MKQRQTRLQRTFWLPGILASILFSGTASATMTEVFGGPGGGPYSLTCDQGQYVIGFHARTGGWVDGIGLICAPFNAQTGKTGSGNRKGYTGGRGGTQQEVYCSPGDPVTGIALVHTRGNGLKRQYVNTVAVSCARDNPRSRCISSGEGCDSILKKESLPAFDFTSSGDRPYDVLNCPSNELATGIQGRSGIYVDSVGLICGPKPAAASGGFIKQYGPGATAPSASGPSKPIKQLGKSKPKATAKNDVDIHDGPGGKFKIIGMMRKGIQGSVEERHADGWLKLRIPAGAPGRTIGWVAEDHLIVSR